MNASISNSQITADKQFETHHRFDTSQDGQESGNSQLRSSQQPPRRRQIDPTTCERDYTTQEREFMVALDNYKRASGRMFPTCSEILEVIRNLGYVQYDLPTRSDLPAISEESALIVG